MINVVDLNPDFEGVFRTGTDREASFKLFIIKTGIPNDFSGIIKGEKWTGFFLGKMNEKQISFNFSSIEICDNPNITESIERGTFEFPLSIETDIHMGQEVFGKYSIFVMSFGGDVVEYKASLQKFEKSFAKG